MKALQEMNKAELRAACKEHGVKNYGKMNNDGMREAILAATQPMKVETVIEAEHVEPGKYTVQVASVEVKGNTVVTTLENLQPQLNEDDQELVKDYGFVNCPNCGVHLLNGVGYHLQEVNGTKIKHDKFQFECLGCCEEFGPEIKKQRTVKTSETHQPFVAREERNGALRPAKAGKCLDVWLALDEIYQMGKGRIPSIKDIRDLATQKEWNLTNASVEFYQWRKFNYLNGSK